MARCSTVSRMHQELSAGLRRESTSVTSAKLEIKCLRLPCRSCNSISLPDCELVFAVATDISFISRSSNFWCDVNLMRRQHRQFRDAGCRIKGTRFAFQMRFKFAAPLVHNGHGGDRRRIAQRTEGASQHVLGKIPDIVDVFFQSAAVVEAGEGFLEPVSAFTAGNTPAAAFMLVELHHAQRKFHHACLVVQNYDAA